MNVADIRLIDTHTHFDAPEFDEDRIMLANQAYQVGVRHLLLVGVLERYFCRMHACKNQLAIPETYLAAAHTKADAIEQAKLTSNAVGDLAPRQLVAHQQILPVPKAHLAFGLHPLYIEQHTQNHLLNLEQWITKSKPVAIGEIGLDTYTATLRQPDIFAKQQDFFVKQLEIATKHRLPALLHIRKSHAEAIRLLKAERFFQRGIAHSFSGGIQEAKALIDLGFKIGITGQVTNPNAKKLRHTLITLVQTLGVAHLVIETDCPDMTPLACQKNHGRRNVPSNLIVVLDALAGRGGGR